MSEALFDPNDIEIEYQTIYNFPYENYGFHIEYIVEDDEWRAIGDDEDIEGEAIILESPTRDIKFVDISLFEEYFFTIEEFEQLKMWMASQKI